MSWLFGLGISMLWYMCLHGFVFIFIMKTEKKSRKMNAMQWLRELTLFSNVFPKKNLEKSCKSSEKKVLCAEDIK